MKPKTSFETLLFKYISPKTGRFEKLKRFRLALFTRSTLKAIEKLNLVFENLEISFGWLKIKINNGYQNKVTPSCDSENF